jgi:probable rRNA maturation factor
MTDDPPYDIEVHVDGDFEWVDAELLTRGVSAALTRFEVSHARISVAVVSDNRIAHLHEEFLDIPGPTDVLTFELADEPEAAIEGEIVASADTAYRGAADREHAPIHELTLYVIHGVLHLLGMDDHAPDEARHMHATEDAILTDMGIGPIFGGP